jgi:VIT1/CCC1 family predicted Fe2+/Mn2+ transporter
VSGEIHHSHRDVSGGWLRPTVFGMMDGLVSNFALIAGLAGAGVSARSVTLGGLAGLFGGAFSMAIGEYISVQSQNELTRAEVAIERRELYQNSAAELEELTQLYVSRGVEPPVARQVAEQISRDPEQALAIHTREELGVDPAALPSPWLAAFLSLVSFTVGAIVPLLPYLFGATALEVSIVLSVAALFGAGAATSRFTARGWLLSGSRQLVLGSVAALVTYGVGQLFNAVIS